MKIFIKHAFAIAALVIGSFAVQAQVKIGSNPTVITPTSNLEVEASTANRKVKIDKSTGQVTIQDGTQGTGRVLTSDAAGGASWKNLTDTTLKIPQTVWIGEQAADYLITTWSGWNLLKDRIPLVPRAGSLPGYDSATKTYTLQSDGYYRFHTGAYMEGTLPTGGTTAVIYLHPASVLAQYENINTGTGPVLSIFWEGFYPAGTVIDTYVISSGGNQNVWVKRAFLSVTKLF